ncbi:MAG: helix-turn-helix transcriptional regulator [Clostridiales bacterium]|nr:helix-turn-helix transcriptional regulator [Clostridiales bacterium]
MAYNFIMPYIDVIKQIMQENNLSQQKLADILGINQTTVSQWLLGRKKPGYDSILMLYEKFAIEPNLLFGIER